MRVGSADAEGTDPGPEGMPVSLPFGQLGVDVERAVIKRNLRIRLFEIKAWRNHPVFLILKADTLFGCLLGDSGDIKRIASATVGDHRGGKVRKVGPVVDSGPAGQFRAPIFGHLLYGPAAVRQCAPFQLLTFKLQTSHL